MIKGKKSYWLWIFIMSFFCYSCESSMKPIKNCLIFIPGKYHNNTDFNPKWLAKNNVKKIIERFYFKGEKEKVEYINVLNFDQNGFLTTEYHYTKEALSNNEILDEADFYYKYDYAYEFQDSFVIKKIPIFPFENNGIELPDSIIEMREKLFRFEVFNFNSAHVITDEENDIINRNIYDKQNRLVEIRNSENKKLVKLDYLEPNKIQLHKRNSHLDFTDELITFNEKGQIVKHYNGGRTSYFIYNDRGEMIEEKLMFDDRPPNHYTYEYLKK